jgi:hypothetical protein
MMRWAGLVTRKGERRGSNKDWMGQHESKKPLGKRKSGWENNII